jgi:hypothetical protein
MWSFAVLGCFLWRPTAEPLIQDELLELLTLPLWPLIGLLLGYVVSAIVEGFTPGEPNEDAGNVPE